MAKTYIDIVKYMVICRFEIAGLVEKPDIIGAVFGQTEGLLGGALDLRELQKSGKIGRIEIESATTQNKTYGKLYLPSSLGRVETCILAAAIESVDRVGPFDTSLKVEKIEDTRNEKRKKVINRAKELLKTLITTEIPDSKELSELVETDVKASTVGTYGPENLPAGPDIASNDEIVLVEGRADVINLLKNDITNCIAIGGATGSIPKTIVELTKSKDTTLFVDGDRGGDMIIKGILSACDVDYIAKAPSGKEVEELTRKDIIKSLRSRLPTEQFLSKEREAENRNNSNNRQYRQDRTREPVHEPQTNQYAQREQQHVQEPEVLSPAAITKKLYEPNSAASKAPVPASEETENNEPMVAHRAELGIKQIDEGDAAEIGSGVESIPTISKGPEVQQKYVDSLTELHNTLRGRLYDSAGNLLKEIPIRELIQSVQDSLNVRTIVFDGIITQRLVELADKTGVRAIYGIRVGQLTRPFGGIVLYTKEQGRI
ncbi:MAG: DNA primase DnaG [Candidatus Micrarchaeia archaeon]